MVSALAEAAVSDFFQIEGSDLVQVPNSESADDADKLAQSATLDWTEAAVSDSASSATKEMAGAAVSKLA